MMYANASYYAIANIILDGRRYDRDPRLHCWEGSRRPANIETHGVGYIAHDIDSINAPCGSGFGVFGERFHIYNILSAYNGFDAEERVYPFYPYVNNFPLADGMTVVYCNGGKIYNITLIDNTDFDLLVGGGPNCEIRDVTITHVNKWAIGGFNVGYMDTGHYNPKTGKKWDGDHTGSKFSNIHVTSRLNMLGYGLSVSSHTFYHGNPDDVTIIDAGTFEDSSSDGAQVGLLFDGAYKGVVRNIRAQNSRGNYHGYNECRVSLNYIAGHFGKEVELQGGFTPMTIHVGDPCPK
ncbi:hypothetical protein K8Q98_00415 [Candidatus Nomurabacteria bacterium]|nr:hypothetical protein [Candidatus Nomurabacteria bacterium]